LKRWRYDVGVVAYAATKFCRKVTALPNPHMVAMRAVGQVVISSRRRASSSRRARIQRAGVVPVASVKRRAKLRRHSGVAGELVDRQLAVEVGTSPWSR
jgi:hypothetical protein